MKKYHYIIITLVTICLLSCHWPDEGGYKYITIVNASDSTIIYSIQPMHERNLPISVSLVFNDTIKPRAYSLAYFDRERDWSWESCLAGSEYLVFSFIGYNTYKACKEKCLRTGIFTIDDKDLLYRKDYTLQDLIDCGFAILYPPIDSIASK